MEGGRLLTYLRPRFSGSPVSNGQHFGLPCQRVQISVEPPTPLPIFFYNSTATTPTSSNEKPFSVYVRLCVNTYTIQNSVSASISAEKLAEAGILLVSIIHAADAPREERKPPAKSVYLQSASRDCEGEMPRSPIRGGNVMQACCQCRGRRPLPCKTPQATGSTGRWRKQGKKTKKARTTSVLTAD